MDVRGPSKTRVVVSPRYICRVNGRETASFKAVKNMDVRQSSKTKAVVSTIRTS